MGSIFKITTFGESHGEAIGGVIDGCPAGIELDFDAIQSQLNRRRPGQSQITTQRKESDEVRFLSGIFEGKTTGTPIGFVIDNEDQRSKDYSHIKDRFRPSHADFTYQEKYGVRDYRGGGRSSARVTAPIVVAGAIAAQVLKSADVSVTAWVNRVQHIQVEQKHEDLDLSLIDSNDIRCPDGAKAEEMIALIKEIKKSGDTVGGEVSCVAKGMPAGWGEPVFDKLHANLARAMININAAKSFEIGSGLAGTFDKGSEQNDAFVQENGETSTLSNNSGGIQGGISNGQDIYFKVGFKPVATILLDQESINEAGESVLIKGKGRHDPCVLPRAVPIVESMCALVLADAMLLNRSAKI